MKQRTSLAVLVLALAATSCGGAQRGDTGQIEEAGSLSVFNFAVGDCFNDPSDGAEQISDVAAVPCADPHDNEVYFKFNLADGPFPGDDAIDAEVEAECIPAFEAYVGASYDTSEVYVFPVTPTQESWDTADDREVVCALYVPDEKLTGSLKGSGR